MFDCGFGDCFQIENTSLRDLLVDFGIHNSSMARRKKQRYDEIINKLPDNCDFLLTHYHKDHYAGALYMGQNSSTTKRFQDVYIPDVWNQQDNIDVVKLLLLHDAISGANLNNNISLIDFLIFICNQKGSIHFISRGKTIQNCYIALWPDFSHIKSLADRIINSIKETNNENSFFLEQIEGTSNSLINITQRMSELTRDSSEQIRSDLNQELRALLHTYDSLRNININRKQRYELSKFGNTISIVFQNKQEADRNILFTGDVEQDIWTKIEQPCDKLYLNNDFDVIKIPHHGTKSHYHDFSRYCSDNTFFLIPNGNIKMNWKIFAQYSSDANSKRASVVCPDNNSCLATNFASVCSCQKPNCINKTENFYIDI